LVERLLETDPERATEVYAIIEGLRAVKAEHSRILGARLQLAKRTREFEEDRKRVFADAKAALKEFEK
jgi:hypothetical protein